MRWRPPRFIVGGMRKLPALIQARELRPCTCLHVIGKWIISMIVFIAGIVHLFFAKITSLHAAEVYLCMTSIDSIYGFRTKLPTEMSTIRAWLLGKDRFRCPTNIGEASPKFPSGLMVILTITLGVQFLICSDWNLGSYSLDILQWPTTDGNRRQIIDW